MVPRGFAALPVLLVAILLLVGVGFYFSSMMSQTPPPANIIVNQVTSPTTEPSGVARTVNSKPISPTAVPIKSTCDTTKNVCFESSNPTVTIQEGYLEDSSNWISNQLTLTGKGSKGYEVKISGFPKEFTLRVPEPNFSDGGKTMVYLRAQKNVAQKGTYKGMITAKSLMTNVTTTADLTLIYSDWNTDAIHTDPSDLSLDCTVRYAVNGINSRELNCDKDTKDRWAKFYYLKNDKTIEIRNIPDNSKDTRSLELVTEPGDSNTLYKGSDVYGLQYNPTGIDMDNLNSEPDGTYKGHFSFVDQSTQKEVAKTSYSLTIHAFKQ